MKKTQIIPQKVLATAAAFLLIGAVQADAGSVTLTGNFDYVLDSSGSTGVTISTPISLQLDWQDDTSVGETTVYFDSALNNTLTLSFGGLSMTNSVMYGAAPYAHFTDNTLDGFEWDWFGAPINGADGTTWSYFFYGFIGDGDPNIIFDIFKEDPGTYAWDPYFTGYLDFASSGTSPVPVPGAAWLLGSGLIGLVGLRRKMK